jgi:hypothetical protein
MESVIRDTKQEKGAAREISDVIQNKKKMRFKSDVIQKQIRFT